MKQKKVNNMLLQWLLNIIVPLYLNIKLIGLNPTEDLYFAKQYLQSYKIQKLSNYVQHMKRYDYIWDPFGGLIDIQFGLKSFIARRGGDCDDWAWANCMLLNAMGYKTYYVTIVSSNIRYNHAFCVIKWEDKYYPVESKAIIYPAQKSIADVMNYYSKLYNTQYIY